jgi:hypothetical protein
MMSPQPARIMPLYKENDIMYRGQNDSYKMNAGMSYANSFKTTAYQSSFKGVAIN